MPWQLIPLVSLHWRRWDDDFVVFDVGSGQTHQLPAYTAATLMMLELNSGDLIRLTSRVSIELGVADDTDLADIVGEAVHDLQTVGLIEFLV